jgi:hypothetical protein
MVDDVGGSAGGAGNDLKSLNCWNAVLVDDVEHRPGEIRIHANGGRMRTAFLLLAVLALTATSPAQSDARPEILVLGTYHMANPGHDL